MSRGVTVWFTGLSGSGKTTIARRVHDRLQAGHILSERLDGDVVRQGLCRDLGFSKEDRDTNIERVTYVSRLLTRNGVVVLSSFISPYRRMRDNARAEIGHFLEVYLRAPLDVLVGRDVKGMYKKAMAGEIQGFTGVNDPYEEPASPDLVLDTDQENVEQSVARVMQLLDERGYLQANDPEAWPAAKTRRIEPSMRVPGPVAPHGGVLVNRELSGTSRLDAIEHARALKTFDLDDREASDLEMIGVGALSPLVGFMGQADYDTVVDAMRLSDNLVWALPVTKAVTKEQAASLAAGEEIALRDPAGLLVAIMQVTEIYPYDKLREAQCCFGTTDVAHPGVARLMAQGEMLIGGPVQVVDHPAHDTFSAYRLTPLETRQRFDHLGWKTVAGFQTRSPMLRVHEHLQKVAMEQVDGLLLHPLIGSSTPDDVPADVRMKTYEVVLERYYPKGRTLLAVFPAVTRHAGPREALWHAIAQKNYGCTHVIVGRAHAGVGDYDGPFDAQILVDSFPLLELGIIPFTFEDTFYCDTCGQIASARTCPHDRSHRLDLSDTTLRELLLAGELPPPEFMRREVAEILSGAYRDDDDRQRLTDEGDPRSGTGTPPRD